MKTNNIWIVVILNSLFGILITLAEPTLEIITLWEKEYIRVKTDSLISSNKHLLGKLSEIKEENTLLKEEVIELKKEVKSNISFIILIPWTLLTITIIALILKKDGKTFR